MSRLDGNMYLVGLSLTPFYVANIDYGKEKGEGANHAVITSDQRPPKTWNMAL